MGIKLDTLYDDHKRYGYHQFFVNAYEALPESLRFFNSMNLFEKTYSCKVHFNSHSAVDYIEFENQSDATMFKLRWA
jgi:hypothetical protein